MNIGIALDPWKLPIFEKHLKEGGYEYENKGSGPGGVIVLTVETTDLHTLRGVITNACAECVRARSN